ncbi:MAG: NTP transferase domain-containing protein [Candidatus Fermentibacteraceae bacterium]|nr:NTP transferase domain-containing protein [Candidatus Fermentibacteraceae bacterium]MBN2609436.1 NTP transferase domain-containing protein [Candidatus Fermentibacteraceae bacterium]
MKGVVLAGGLGTRLRPLTSITNKHLLPVYDQPMIFYPLQKLAEAGIRDVMLITGGNSAGDFLRLLGDGSDFGFRTLNYAYQVKEGGIAEAIGLTRTFIGGDRFVVILGDNILEDSLKPRVDAFREQREGARILLKVVDNPSDYGVAELDGTRVVSIEEKPARPKSRYAVIGVYMYDSFAFEVIDRLEPSARGELEVTDINNAYLENGTLHADIVKGWWADSGSSIDGLLQAGIKARQLRVEEGS